MPWIQRNVSLTARKRGFHLITRDVLAALPELARIRMGLLHVFIQHTSASLTINENADPDVPADLESSLSTIAPEDFPYRHHDRRGGRHARPRQGCSLGEQRDDPGV